MTYTDAQIDKMVTGYVECALWADLDISRLDDDGNSPTLDENYDSDDVSEEALADIRRELAEFSAANEADLGDMEPDYIGHNFHLTRNHHGTGFWDRGLGDAGTRLTAACNPYGESTLVPGGDDKLYKE